MFAIVGKILDVTVKVVLKVVFVGFVLGVKATWGDARKKQEVQS